MKVLTAALIKSLEENAVNSGNFSFKQLMYLAGNTLAETITKRFNLNNKKIAVVCGRGNNGGDGFVIARHLYEYGADVTVVTPLGPPTTKCAKHYYNLLKPVKLLNSIDGDFDIIIDALFGIGLNRPLDENTSALIKRLNKMPAIRVAVDVPSGCDTDTGKILGAAFKADLTVTFTALKPCFMLPEASDYCGEVVVADIGLKAKEYAFLTNQRPVFEKRRHNAHKGSFGTAVMFCGSYSLAGAAILSARAALRSGVGIAKCIICDNIYTPFTCAVPEAVCVPVKPNALGTFSRDLELEVPLKKATALLFGCGVGCNEDIIELLKKLILTSNVPIVIDADGINALSLCIDILKKRKCEVILTPHPAEMARLCGCSVKEIEANRIEIAKSFAKKHNCHLVLKGADTIIARPDGSFCINTNGNPGMATGGSGDVLAGIMVSLLAQGIEISKAVAAAVYLHGEAGDKAALKYGERAMLPSDIIDLL